MTICIYECIATSYVISLTLVTKALHSLLPYWWLMTLIKRKNIHPIFKCSDLATHITQSTRSTQWAQTSLAEADHYSHMPTVKILRLGGERLPPSKKKKKKKSFGSLPLPQSGYATTIMVFFAHLFLLIYSSQKVPTSLKFYRALHILVLHMHRKFDVDSIDSFWDTEEQSTQLTRRKERRKKRTSRSKTRKVIITWWLLTHDDF